MGVEYDISQAKLAFQLAGGDPDELHVLRYRGTEGLSQLFRYEIELSSFDGGLSLGDYTGRPATLTIRAPGGDRYVHGVVSRFELTGEGVDETFYRAELVPALWLLTHRYGSRIFQKKSVPEIIQNVLTAAGIVADRFSMRLFDEYAARDYCVQYRETDFNFITRLMEEEGIYYFFEHTGEAETLVMADASVASRAIDGDPDLPFVPPSGLKAPAEHVRKFRVAQEVRPGNVVLRDFNFENPRLNLQVQSGLDRDDKLEFSDYPGEYALQAGGRRLAKLRAEEFECRRKVGHGASDCHRLAPGRTFVLTSHPRPELDTEYLITKVTVQGKQAVTRSTNGSLPHCGLVDAHVLQSLIAARQSGDNSALRNVAEAVTQLIRRIPQADDTASPALARWLYHAGQIASDPAAAAAALGADPLELLSLQSALASGAGSAPVDRDGPVYECSFECIPAEVTFRPPRVTPWPEIRGCQTATVVGPAGEEIYCDEHGRVKVQFHWDRYGKKDEHSSCWIRASQPWAGPGFGGLAIPRIGQEVIIDFLEGDPDRPIIVGRVYNGDSMPPQALPASKVRTSIRSNSHLRPEAQGKGFNEITMDDTNGQEHFYEKAQFDKTVEIGNNRNTSVGVDATELVGNNDAQVVGNNKSTDVANAYNVSCDTMLINAKTSITLQCGASRIHMNQAGFITITGTVITSAAAINNSVVAPLTQIVGAAMLAEAGAVIQVLGGVTQIRAAGQASLYGGKTDVVASGDNVIQGSKVKIN